MRYDGSEDFILPSMKRLSDYFPIGLALLFLVFWIFLAIDPVYRDVWWAENIPVMAVFFLLAATFYFFRFSNLAYVLMAFWLFLHTIGGHYTFAHVPLQAFTEFFGMERNQFDRIAHFTVGFYAYPIAEFLQQKNLSSKVTKYFFALFAIMAIAAAYEIAEWWYAATNGGAAGIEFLGSQGDVWDAQKDMLADTLGALFALVLFSVFGRRAIDFKALEKEINENVKKE